MPYIKIPLLPGVHKDDTPLSAEGFFIDADKVRFVRGRAQTIGGWEAAAVSALPGFCRGMHTWRDNAGLATAALGTHSHLFAYQDAGLYDITPVVGRGQLSNPFSTTISSATVTVAHTAHGRAAGDGVTFAGASAVGGLTVSGVYAVATATDANTYTIAAASVATSTAGPGGGTVDYQYFLAVGLADSTGGSGYGTGAYGVGGYGLPSSTVYYARTCSVDNWGQNLVASPRGGAIYEWAPAFSNSELITNGAFAVDASWTKGTGWSIGAGVASKTAGTGADLEQTVVLTSGAYFLLAFDYTRSAGTLQPKIGSANLGSVLSAASGHIKIVFFTGPGSLKFSGDSAFAGTVDNVTVKQILTASLLPTAPAQNTCIFVTPERILAAAGTTDVSGSFDPMLVRWSDQENNQTWTASAINQAGDYRLARGGRIVGAKAGRGENYIWTDDSLYTMRYVPDPNVVYSFSHIGAGCGLIGPNAAIVAGGVAFWMSSSGEFFRYAGGIPQPLKCTVRRDVFDHLAKVQQDKVYAFSVAAYSEVWWLYPDSRDGNECSRYVAYNVLDDTWTTGTFNRTAWVDAGAFAYPLAASDGGALYFHEKGNSADGGPLAWSLTTAASDVGDGDRLMRLMGLIPDFDDVLGGVKLTVDTHLFPNSVAVTSGPFDITSSTNKVDIRALGRQAAFRFSGNSAPAFARFGTLRADISDTGIAR